MKPFEFAILRYCHSLAEGELVNVGVVMYLPESGEVLYRVNEHYKRLSAFYGNFDGQAYRLLVRRIQARLESAPRSHDVGIFEPLASVIAPAFQWSEVMAGLTPDPETRLEQLFVELVTPHDKVPEAHHDEKEIMKTVSRELRQIGLSTRLVKDYSLKSDRFAWSFHYGWKNGKTQVLEPVSFDLKTGPKIVDKAHTWTGRLVDLSQSNEFEFTAVVAPPRVGDLEHEYRRACAILREQKNVREVVVESEFGQFAPKIQRDLQQLS